MEENTKPKTRSSKQTTPKRPDLKIYFVFGCISVLFIVITLLFKESLSPDQQFYFKILFALGCAGIAATIPGITKLQYKGAIAASGAIVVFVLIFSLDPPKKKFGLTIFPKTPAEESISLGNTTLKLQLTQGFLEGVVTSEQTIKFNDVPNEYYGDSIRLFLSAGDWVFGNGLKSQRIKLEHESIDVYFKRPAAYLSIGGALYYRNAPLAGAVIIDSDHPHHADTTDAFGKFRFIYPDDEPRVRVKFNVVKNQLILPPLEINMGNNEYETNFQQ
ncbi:hypothetical protein [Paraflavitalea pollutisoli]|uniref:hypothetical protein n=1 Tax=Paraflavitalea pollutisoli TaxID=3034143 RepID=UPI0023ED34AB|nr:hypothetical protein [Paraflavitalea sp. H1-2-19X]